MSGNFVLLEEAAKLLGIAPDALVEMRSRGEIRGFREGSSWKFKMEDIQQAIRNRQDAGDSDIGSDVSLIADPGSGSDVKLVAGRSGTNLGDSQIGSDISLDSSIKIDLDGSDLPLDAAGGSGLELSLSEGSDVLEASGLKLSPASGTDKIITGDSDPDIGSDLELADDDDLVLGGGSDLALAKDSGLNLMSPSDSGISLEDAPLDLAANSGISALDLAADSKVSKGASASGSGSLVNFQQDEEFQLSPSSGDMELEEDSGSQVIELEDSSDFGDAAVALPSDGGMGMGASSGEAVDIFGGAAPMSAGGGGGGGMSAGPAAVAVAAPDIPLGTVEVVLLMLTLTLMCLCGIMVSDIIVNMWAWNSQSDMTSGFTSAVLSAFGMK
ncbi:MAG: helix-turn-helix domain-containing protein [Planctomycetaceae bacterium]|nr:helix-turn-helix domain-containing protein [Planctomycetaceae bacterium]